MDGLSSFRSNVSSSSARSTTPTPRKLATSTTKSSTRVQDLGSILNKIDSLPTFTSRDNSLSSTAQGLKDELRNIGEYLSQRHDSSDTGDSDNILKMVTEFADLVNDIYSNNGDLDKVCSSKKGVITDLCAETLTDTSPKTSPRGRQAIVQSIKNDLMKGDAVVKKAGDSNHFSRGYSPRFPKLLALAQHVNKPQDSGGVGKPPSGPPFNIETVNPNDLIPKGGGDGGKVDDPKDGGGGDGGKVGGDEGDNVPTGGNVEGPKDGGGGGSGKVGGDEGDNVPTGVEDGGGKVDDPKRELGGDIKAPVNRLRGDAPAKQVYSRQLNSFNDFKKLSEKLKTDPFNLDDTKNFIKEKFKSSVSKSKEFSQLKDKSEIVDFINKNLLGDSVKERFEFGKDGNVKEWGNETITETYMKNANDNPREAFFLLLGDAFEGMGLSTTIDSNRSSPPKDQLKKLETALAGRSDTAELLSHIRHNLMPGFSVKK